jgi:hypothetical protein
LIATLTSDQTLTKKKDIMSKRRCLKIHNNSTYKVNKKWYVLLTFSGHLFTVLNLTYCGSWLVVVIKTLPKIWFAARCRRVWPGPHVCPSSGGSGLLVRKTKIACHRYFICSKYSTVGII